MSDSLSDEITRVLSPLVGEVLTRVSLDLESQRLGKTPETLTREDLAVFAANLQRQLRLFVGPEVAATAGKRVASLKT